MRVEMIWIEQCRAARAIKRRIGAKSALDDPIGEKLRVSAAARAGTAFARELPRFLAPVCRVFDEYELAGYVGMQKPSVRRRLRALLYFSWCSAAHRSLGDGVSGAPLSIASGYSSLLAAHQ